MRGLGQAIEVPKHVEDDLACLGVDVEAKPCALGYVVLEDAGVGEVGGDVPGYLLAVEDAL